LNDEKVKEIMEKAKPLVDAFDLKILKIEVEEPLPF
jgi:hypothetical protein